MGTSVLIGIAAVIIVIAFAGVLGIIFFSTEAGSRARRPASGERQKQTLPLTGDDLRGLDLRLPGILHITQDRQADESLTVTLDDDMLPHLVTRIEAGGVLLVGYEPPPGVVVLEPSRPPVFALNLHHPETLRLTGDTQVTAGGLSVTTLDMTLSGAVALHLDDLQAASVSIRLTGRARATIGGTCAELRLSASGMVVCDAASLQCEVVTANLDGMAEATVWAKSALSVTLGGSARLEYYGDPQLDEAASGRAMLLRRGSAPG